MTTSENLEGKTESLHLLEQELAAASEHRDSDEELAALRANIHALRLDLGIEVELTDEQRVAYSEELRDPNTSIERVQEIDSIAKRSVPPNP
jgi:hypothetical protein